jgi:hypothetical protein
VRHYSSVPTRTEQLKIEVDLNADKFEKFRSRLKPFIADAHSIVIQEGDVFKVSYSFTAEYYGSIVERFEALILMINDPEITVRASIEELNGLKCLFAEMILAIERRQTTT